jgi:site-specific recombinase XerD
MGAVEVNDFLSHIACDLGLSASAQNQALCAIKFMYDKLLQRELGRIEGLIWSKKPKKLPCFYSKEEIFRVLDFLSPPYWLMVLLSFGTGLRISEVLNLTVRSIDTKRQVVRVIQGKGGKDREVDLPRALNGYLHRQIGYALSVFDSDMSGRSSTVVQFGRAVHYRLTIPANSGDQRLFPRAYLNIDHNQQRVRRPTYSRQAVNKALKKAMRLAEVRIGSFHHLRHSYATEALSGGMNIRHLQENLGHNSVVTTEIYTHIKLKDRQLLKSPADNLIECPKSVYAVAWR